jgi:alcohol dehydrogenase
MASFDYTPRTRTVFEAGGLERLGLLARELGGRRALLACDAGVRDAGYGDRAAASLRSAGLQITAFHDFDSNPRGEMVARGAELARREQSDILIGLGGGSSMDCAKGINFLLSGGGEMRDYWGWGKLQGARTLPSIGVPTTAGTGSEAQSYALISDTESHAKMACGDPGAAFRIALLDPELTLTQPARVAAVAGYDALSHAVETWVTTKRTPFSELFSREAWRLLQGHYERVLAAPGDLEARGAMLLGAHYAGIAIENSMLGATHACANPLTARHGTEHGIAIGVLLPHVARWNAGVAAPRYAELLEIAGLDAGKKPAERLASRLEELARVGGLPGSLAAAGIERSELPALADDAARQWTGRFNPRPFDAQGALEVYEWAFSE